MGNFIKKQLIILFFTISFLFLFYQLSIIHSPVSGTCYAGGMLGDRLTFGPDDYLENSLDLSIDFDNGLYSSIGYSFSKDDNSEDTQKAYLFNLGYNFTDSFSSGMQYSFSPDIAGYKYDTIGANLSFSESKGGINDDDFDTMIFIDFSQTNHSANVYIDTTTVWRKRIHIDTTWTLEQNSWTFGLIETFYRDTVLSLNYSSFSYDKDIKNPQFQRYLDFILALGGIFNTKLPGVLFSISSFPASSYSINLTQYFSDYFCLGFDYNRLINYIDNSMVFYYSLEAECFLSESWQLNSGYTLYIDENKDEFNYYSSGISFMF